MENLTIEVLTHFINNVGFPIAVSIALFINNYQTTKNNTKILNDLQCILKENTTALQELSERVKK